jgi:2-methylisocitrate lyase-like PEP mutase family enzyme
MTNDLAGAAKAFRDLHRPGDPVLLANCWDAGSARLIEATGARALATTSAGLAWSHGYPDGDAIPLPVLTAAVSQIARVISVPLTVDIEGGFSSDPARVGAVVEAVIGAGGIGINVEDGRGAPELLAAKIGAARAAGARLGVPLFINARIDVYLRSLVPPDQAVEEVIRRARMYREAGADGAFPAGIVEPDAIRAVTTTTGMPVNVLVESGLPPVDELRDLGVARVSAGSGVAQMLFGAARDAVSEFLGQGRYDTMLGGSMDYGEIQALFVTAESAG